MYCGSYVYFLLIERAKKKVSQEDTLFLFVKYRPRDLEQLALWKGLLRPFSEAELKQLTRGATSNTYWKISNISKAFHFLNIMGVHQRQRPVPKGHATRKIIVGQLLHAEERKTKDLQLFQSWHCQRSCHSFLFYQSCTYLLIFCNFFCRSFSWRSHFERSWWKLSGDTFAFCT